MLNAIYIRGAYGRKYNDIMKARTDWNDGKDFQDAQTGQYMSVRDIGRNIGVFDTVYMTSNGSVIGVITS